MSKHSELAAAIADLVKTQGNMNGQRWHVDQGEVIKLIEAHESKPAPAKKVAKKVAKKAPAKKGGSDGPQAGS